MERAPTGEEPVDPVLLDDPPAPPVEAGTLTERMEETRLKVDALKREVAAAIAGRRAGAD